ncbi:MAG TPA: thiol:disulfide interchange protein DsbA/DsbL [Burkholderiales bacterium]|nr:thiol:disulfide interchange protein DsbA/DsbL [Burkholderiales bacterium]
MAILRTIAALLLLGAAALAQAEPMQDVDYVLIDPPAGRPGQGIEVLEFFHYGCGACYRLEPLLSRWVADLPGDVRFLRVPALRNSSWIPLTRLFFALDELGALPQLHSQAFRDIHESRLNLRDAARAAQWAQDNGLDHGAFTTLLESEEMKSRVQQARDLTLAYGVRSTPSVAVDGRYLTSAAMTGSVDALLPVVDALIDKARAARGGR